MEHTNWLSIIISSVIPLIVGFIYYHKNLFGKIWMNSLDISEEDLKKGNKFLILVLSLAMSFLLSIFLINFNNSTGQEGEFDNFAHGAWHGFFVSFVVGMPILFINGLMERKKYWPMFSRFNTIASDPSSKRRLTRHRTSGQVDVMCYG